jgi:hypothetical protein
MKYGLKSGIVILPGFLILGGCSGSFVFPYAF